MTQQEFTARTGLNVNPETYANIEKVRQALDNGKCLRIEFYKDGSGACFHFIDPHGDHGLPCDRLMSFSINEAMQIVSGFRFKQHELNKCY
jgi:hypothetical protein|nr:MAG TPA: hypothetical protein [Caudoviricetes sp.]